MRNLYIGEQVGWMSGVKLYLQIEMIYERLNLSEWAALQTIYPQPIWAARLKY